MSDGQSNAQQQSVPQRPAAARSDTAILFVLLLPLFAFFLRLMTLGLNPLTHIPRVLLPIISNFTVTHMSKTVVLTSLFVFTTTMFLARGPKSVYLLDFVCWQPSRIYESSPESYMENARRCGYFSEASLDFQERIIYKTGLGPRTYLPPTVWEPRFKVELARDEARDGIFSSLDKLFAASPHLNPQKDVDILVVNAGTFAPLPSLCSMIINHYKMKNSIIAYSLSGMGCSGALLSLDLVRDLFQIHRNAHAVVVSTETINATWYRGNNRDMLVANTIFRAGCAVMLLTNRSSERGSARYTLRHVIRTHKGADDNAYRAIYEDSDAEGVQLQQICGDALKDNILTLSYVVIPLVDQLRFFLSQRLRPWLPARWCTFKPDIKAHIDHFCLHPGGLRILDALQRNLHLTASDCDPARSLLYRYGNLSSSSMWYELAYLERRNRIKRGHKVWQLAFGSGFKCSSALWIALKGAEQPRHDDVWPELWEDGQLIPDDAQVYPYGLSDSHRLPVPSPAVPSHRPPSVAPPPLRRPSTPPTPNAPPRRPTPDSPLPAPASLASASTGEGGISHPTTPPTSHSVPSACLPVDLVARKTPSPLMSHAFPPHRRTPSATAFPDAPPSSSSAAAATSASLAPSPGNSPTAGGTSPTASPLLPGVAFPGIAVRPDDKDGSTVFRGGPVGLDSSVVLPRPVSLLVTALHQEQAASDVGDCVQTPSSASSSPGRRCSPGSQQRSPLPPLPLPAKRVPPPPTKAATTWGRPLLLEAMMRLRRPARGAPTPMFGISAPPAGAATAGGRSSLFFDTAFASPQAGPIAIPISGSPTSTVTFPPSTSIAGASSLVQATAAHPPSPSAVDLPLPYSSAAALCAGETAPTCPLASRPIAIPAALSSGSSFGRPHDAEGASLTDAGSAVSERGAAQAAMDAKPSEN